MCTLHETEKPNQICNALFAEIRKNSLNFSEYALPPKTDIFFQESNY